MKPDAINLIISGINKNLQLNDYLLSEESQYCRSLKAINNGRCFCESKSDLQYCEPFFPGMHVECVCKEGYKLIGQSIVTCKQDGLWDYSMPSCVQGKFYYPVTISIFSPITKCRIFFVIYGT